MSKLNLKTKGMVIFTLILFIGSISNVNDQEYKMDVPTSVETLKLAALSIDLNLSDADASFHGEAASDYSGEQLKGVGDVNGDGFDDVLIGVKDNNEFGSGAGQTYLIFGKASGWSRDVNLSSVDASFYGEAAGDDSGYSVAGAGDVNGDGFDDVLIGAKGNGEGGNLAGQTYLILGKASGWIMDVNLSSADASFYGEAASDYSGYSVAGAGDVNGDGFDDVLIGADGNDEGDGDNAGQTYLIFGKASGWSMDVNLSSANASFHGEADDDYSGIAVTGAGDVNGDGYDDVLIGADGNDEGGSGAGQTYLILGKASGWSMDVNLSSANASFHGEVAGEYTGDAIAGAGDVNGDGFNDVLIGADRNNDGGSQTGQTYVILGKASGWSRDVNLSNVDASFYGEAINDNSGVSVAGAGDVNGDGFDDVLIGADGNDDGGDLAGKTYLILGKASGWIMDVNLSSADASFHGEAAEDYSGLSVAGAGDVNGDGADDLLIGAYGNSYGGDDAGKVYLIFGVPPGPGGQPFIPGYPFPIFATIAAITVLYLFKKRKSLTIWKNER